MLPSSQASYSLLLSIPSNKKLPSKRIIRVIISRVSAYEVNLLAGGLHGYALKSELNDFGYLISLLDP